MADEVRIDLILNTQKALSAAKQFAPEMKKALTANVSGTKLDPIQKTLQNDIKSAKIFSTIMKDSVTQYSTALDDLAQKATRLQEINERMAPGNLLNEMSRAKRTGSISTASGETKTYADLRAEWDSLKAEKETLIKDINTDLALLPKSLSQMEKDANRVVAAGTKFKDSIEEINKFTSVSKAQNTGSSASNPFKNLTGDDDGLSDIVKQIYAFRDAGEDTTVLFDKLSRKLNEFVVSGAEIGDLKYFLNEVDEAMKLIINDLDATLELKDVYRELFEAAEPARKAFNDLKSEARSGITNEQQQVNAIYTLVDAYKQERQAQKEAYEQALAEQQAQQAQDSANSVLALASAYKQVREEQQALLSQAIAEQQEQQAKDSANSVLALVSAYKQVRAEQQEQLNQLLAEQQEQQYRDSVNSIYALVAATKDFEAEIIAVKADVTGVTDAINVDPAINNIAELIRRYQTLSEAKKQMEDMGLPKELDGTYATTVRVLAQLNTQINTYKKNLSETANTNEKSKKATDKFSSALRGLNSTVKSIKSGFKSLNHSSNGVKSSFDKMANSMRSNFKHMITSLTKYVLGFRSLFFLVRRFRKYIGEGIQNMAQFNDGNNHVNESITRLLSSLLFLKNAWATAFSPILQFVTPILENLIDTLAEVGNAFSRFIGGLLGQTTVFQAVKVDAQDYADSLDKAAGSAGSAADKTKKLTDRLAAFDDLNVLGVDNDPDGTGSGGGGGSADAYVPDPNEMFKLVEVDNKHFIEAIQAMWEKADFSELGKSIKERIMSALESIKWEEDVYPTVRKIMSSLGTFIVGLFGDPKFWEDLGDFGAGLFNAIIYGLQAFLETTDGVDFGGMIASGLNKFLTGTDWEQAGLNVNKLGKQLIDNLISFFNTADKRAVASAIADFLKGVNIPELAIGIGKLILTAASVSIDIIGGIIVESALDVDNLSADQLAYITQSWEKLIHKILVAVAYSLTAGTGIGPLIVDLLMPPKDEDGNTDWSQIGYDIANGILWGLGDYIKTSVTNGNWMAENVFQPMIDALKDIFKIGSPSKVMEEYGGYIGEGMLNGISALMPDVEQIFTNFKKWLEDTWYNIRTIAVSNFWTMKTKIVEAFDAINDGIKNIINNGILPVVEGMINFLIDGLNGFIDRLNSIPDVTFKSPFTGEDVTLGVDLSRIGHVSIPRLAQGAVIPPNREFMAVLGDQSHGTNIEAPLDTIKQAVAEVLANNGNAEMIQLLQQLITVVESKNLVIGDKDIGRANARYTQQQNRIRGVGF